MHDMHEALKRRKGKGLDITILVGGEQMDANGQAKGSDLAPSVKDKPEMGMNPMHGLAGLHHGMDDSAIDGKPEPDADDQPDLTDDMTDFDKQDLMNRKPRSLGDRARMSAMHKMGKKV